LQSQSDYPFCARGSQYGLGDGELMKDTQPDRSVMDRQMKKETKGVCFLFSETGTEGGWWATQEDGFVSDDGHWRYEGARYPKEGDDFTVYAGDGSVLFHGIIHQDSRTGAISRQAIRNGKLVGDPTWKQQVVGGFWVHWIQKTYSTVTDLARFLG
jgi:hypothetical protein